MLAGCTKTVDKAIPVGVAAVRTDNFSNGYATVGVVEPETQVEVVSKYSGTVEHTFKEVGDPVVAGDILLQLDIKPVMNQIKSAQAILDQTNVTVAQTKLQYQTALENAIISYNSAQLTLQQTQNSFDNTNTLFESGAVSKSELDTVQSALDKAIATTDTAKTVLAAAQNNLDIYIQETSAIESNSALSGSEAAVNVPQTQLEILQSQLKDYTVISPINGIIIKKNAVTGGMVGQSPVYSVANIDQVILSTAVPKEEINKLSLGGIAQVFFADKSYLETPITALSNSANAANLYMVQITVENPDHYFKPGMNAKIVFVESQNKNLVVPFNSVVSSGKDHYIFIIEDNTAKKVFVKVLGRNSDEIAIEPLGVIINENIEIAAYNANLLKDGDTIKREH